MLSSRQLLRRISLPIMAVLYLLAGINHFLRPQFYRAIMPLWIPGPLAMIYLTGIWEMGAAVLLCFPRTRRLAAWLILLLLIIVFPANIQMAVNWRSSHHPNYWIALARLPLQAVLVWWAWLYTKAQTAAQ